MRKASFILMALSMLLFFSCEEKKQGTVELPVKIVPLDSIPGIFEAHGTIGENTTMNVLEFINDDGDTLYVQVNNQAVMGGVNVGDEVELIYNVTMEENVASVAVNLTALQHMWSQRGADGKEQSLELDAKGRATTYDMAVDYETWEVKDGLLLLRSPKKLGDETPAIVDTFEIMQLTADSLVLMNGNLVTEFERYN
ncbi:MAG: hypothetical protein IJP75_06750 [Bacteroidaceae bacterium]|nr:hypothetical protein [Bacteroidaceae bacterium]